MLTETIRSKTARDLRAEVNEDGSGFNVLCLIGAKVSRAFPPKSYKTKKAVYKRVAKFMERFED